VPWWIMILRKCWIISRRWGKTFLPFLRSFY